MWSHVPTRRATRSSNTIEQHALIESAWVRHAGLIGGYAYFRAKAMSEATSGLVADVVTKLTGWLSCVTQAQRHGWQSVTDQARGVWRAQAA